MPEKYSQENELLALRAHLTTRPFQRPGVRTSLSFVAEATLKKNYNSFFIRGKQNSQLSESRQRAGGRVSVCLRHSTCCAHRPQQSQRDIAWFLVKEKKKKKRNFEV